MPEPMQTLLWHEALCKQGRVTWPGWMRQGFRQEPLHVALWDRIQNRVFDYILRKSQQ